MRSRGHHPHFAGHRSGGLHVGASAKRGGPQPGQTEFSPQEEQAMRAGAPASGAAPAAPGPAPGGGMPMGGAPVPQDLDQDGGI